MATVIDTPPDKNPFPGEKTGKDKQNQKIDCAIGGQGWRPSIAVALSFGFGGITMLALAIVIWLSLHTARDNTFSLTREITEISFGSIRSHLDNKLNTAANQVAYMANLVEQGLLDPDDSKAVIQTIKGALAATPQVTGMAIMKLDGTSIRAGWLSKNAFLSQNDKNRQGYDDLFSQTLYEMSTAKGVHWGGIVWIEEKAEPHIAVYHPLYRNSEYIGVIGAIISISSLSEYLDKLDKDTGNHTYLLLNKRMVLAHPSLIDMSRSGLTAANPLPNLDQVIDGNLRLIWDEPLVEFNEILGDGTIKGHLVDSFSGEITFLHTNFSGYGFDDLTLGIYFKEGELEDYYDRLYLTGYTALAVALISVVLIFFSGRFIAQPLLRMSRASQQVSNLDLVHAERLPGSMFRELDVAANAYNSMLGGLKWFENYVPKTLVKQLMELDGEGILSQERDTTVMFTDIVSFTSLSESMPPAELAELLNHYFSLLGDCIESEAGTIDKYIGDSIMAFWGAPSNQEDHAALACRAALKIETALARDNAARERAGLLPIQIRIGIHSGPAIAGNIGAKGRVNYTLIGDTVNTAQRLEALAKEALTDNTHSAKILISSATRDLLGKTPTLTTTLKGTFALRGRENTTEVYELTSSP
ncbi:adenylate/guanylate cyclase domain-containing protein [Kiloniella laminariae]|uniref:adenylate/guanylate cyclase domain-containing protein n=1 Tax=Kiloniella laminariae TaxID=454162 RepID=UPI00037D9458|nr:adenylate/guanylate cyclase domain-containing protein [Kiloniella laminariae]